ncbi:MAG: oligosaccharide flippase family protein [Oscillochloris sp.]|nr:oligosaccharide flippase family protein [Oscillochloris sp.]
MRDLWLKIIATGGTRLFTLLSGLVILTVIARWLGPAGRGAVGAAIGWATLFSTFGGLSLGQVAIYQATAQRGQAWLGKTLGSLLVLAGALSGLGWLVAAILYAATGGAVYGEIAALPLLIAFLNVPALIWDQYGSQLLLAVRQVGTYNRAQLVGRAAGLALIGVAAALGGGVPGMIAALVLAQWLISVQELRALLRVGDQPVRSDRATVAALLKGGMLLHLNAIGAFLFTSTDVLIINYYHGPGPTGYYQVAVDLLAALMVVPQAAATVLYSQGAELGPDALWGAQRKVLALVIAGMLAIASVAALCAPWVVPLVLGPSFNPSVGIFQLLLLTLAGSTLSTMMAPQWIGRGLFVQTSALTLAVGLANLAANLALVPRYGVSGAIWATVGSYGIAIITNGWMIVRCELAWRCQGQSLNENRGLW